MATTSASANVVSKSQTQGANVVSKSATPNAKTQRVLETRDQWAVIFNHTLSLVVTLAKGEALPENPRKGFAFGKTAEQPNARGYAQSLLAGFVSRKANKFFAEVDGLKTIEEREKIAIAILVATSLGGSEASRAKGILGKAEPKQVRSFSEATLVALSQAIPQKALPKAKRAETAETAPTEQPTEESKKSSSAKQKKSRKSASKASK
jgi:hypothetical protein